MTICTRSTNAERVAQFTGDYDMLDGREQTTDGLARSHRAFDAYPYIFLNLMLSLLAAMQAPVITMSQHRQTERDRVATQMDADVNLKAEREICSLHEKLDALREAQWADLVRTQQEQIGLLEQLLGRPIRGDRFAPNGAGAPGIANFGSAPLKELAGSRSRTR